MGEFSLNRARNRDPVKHARQKIDVSDQNQIVDWAGIGDHQTHRLEPQVFENSLFLLKFFDSVFLINAVGLEEAVQLDPGQAQHPA